MGLLYLYLYLSNNFMFTVNQVVCSAARGTLLGVKRLVTSPKSDLTVVKTHVRLNQTIQVPAICWQVLSENVDLMSAATTWTANYSPPCSALSEYVCKKRPAKTYLRTSEFRSSGR